MIIHKIGNLLNFDSFFNCEILKFVDFRICKIWEMFEIFRIERFWKFQNLKFFQFSK